MHGQHGTLPGLSASAAQDDRPTRDDARRAGTPDALPRGQPGSQFFVLIDGLAQRQSSYCRLALMHGGAWFGKAALINKTTERASVTPVVESAFIVFDRSEFNALRHGV